MRPELQATIEKARTGTVAANLLTVELSAFIEELQEEAEGWWLHGGGPWVTLRSGSWKKPQTYLMPS